jgi:transcriptional regulator with XRE-family HTH domain
MGIGEAWKKRREEMGKTVEDVSSEIRISKKYLRGIEEGNFSRFPAKVFSIGFIRAYATFLSVDPEPLLSEYLGLFERSSKEEPPAYSVPGMRNTPRCVLPPFPRSGKHPNPLPLLSPLPSRTPHCRPTTRRWGAERLRQPLRLPSRVR